MSDLSSPTPIAENEPASLSRKLLRRPLTPNGGEWHLVNVRLEEWDALKSALRAVESPEYARAMAIAKIVNAGADFSDDESDQIARALQNGIAEGSYSSEGDEEDVFATCAEIVKQAEERIKAATPASPPASTFMLDSCLQQAHYRCKEMVNDQRCMCLCHGELPDPAEIARKRREAHR